MGELNPGGLGNGDGADERRQRRLLFSLSVKGTVGTEDGSRRERAIFGLPTPSDSK
jgi:hypothetical protein